jgi:hypothetical protein
MPGFVIPLTGPYAGYPGNISRNGDEIIVNRPLRITDTVNAYFGDPAVLNPDSTGGTWSSVAGFIAAASGLILPTSFAGIFSRNVKTDLVYPVLGTSNTNTGFYSPGELADVGERGTATVLLRIYSTAPTSGSAVYIRTAYDSNNSAGVVGGFETSKVTADVTAITLSTTSGSTTATVSANTGLAVGQVIGATGVTAGTFITNINGTTLTLSSAATATESTEAATFTSYVQIPTSIAVFKTGAVDARGVTEITILTRQLP